MKVCVYGLGHLGSVTAGCLALAGHEVTVMDFQEYPTGEPGVANLLMACKTGDLSSVKDAEILWVTFDTPVDEDDQAAVDFVFGKIREVLPMVGEPTPVIISSQLPVGSIAKLEAEYLELHFACIPENLRRGTAVKNFLEPDRIVVGMRERADRRPLLNLLGRITHHVEWMSIESAEMTKHAINAWMAMSICFANEIATICDKVGADPKEVERGMRTEERIGAKAYIRPGGPYEGKTLARDLEYLRQIIEKGVTAPLLLSIPVSNVEHRRRTGK